MSSPVPAPNFGRLIHRKSLPRLNAIFMSVPALALGGLALSAGPLNGMSIGVLLLALLLLALCAWSLTYKAAIYENGATVESIFGHRSLSFRDLRTFGYSRIIRRGQPMDTLTFVPRNGKPLRIVTQPDFRAGPDQDLLQLVNAMTPRYTERLEKELTRARRVPWVTRVPGTAPVQPGVALTSSAFLLEAGKETVTFPFADVDTTIENGMFIVTNRSTGKRAFTIPCYAPNFYPGLALLQKLNTAAAPAATQVA